jgi:hypothetical protein
MKRFYFALAIFYWATQPLQAGMTVLVHGFQIKGEMRAHWYDFAKAIQRRNQDDAVILKFNPTKQVWEQPEGTSNTAKPTHATEFIFIYDWAAMSNDVFEQGSLEVAADRLFTMLSAPTGAPNENINFITQPGHKHFVGHSRGCVLLLQVLRRIAKYHPEVKIDRWTTLDPHPTSIKDKLLWGISPNPTFNYQIMLPNNVLTAENYFRRASTLRDWYEPLNANYSGIPVVGASLNDQKQDSILMGLNNGCSYLAHTNVPGWYFGTINPQESLILYRNCNEKHQPPMEKWYPQGRTTLGYNAVLPPAQGVSPALLDAQKPDLQPVFNGDFKYAHYGWKASHLKNNHAQIHAKESIQHELMYFPAAFQSLQWSVKSTQAVSLNITFFDAKGVLIQSIVQKTVASKTAFQDMKGAIPSKLIGKVGSFSIQNMETDKNNIAIIDKVFL